MIEKQIHEGWTEEEWNKTKNILDKMLEPLYNKTKEAEK